MFGVAAEFLGSGPEVMPLVILRLSQLEGAQHEHHVAHPPPRAESSAVGLSPVKAVLPSLVLLNV